jgi:glycosyltransferase involved in cell wall biosynthesis
MAKKILASLLIPCRNEDEYISSLLDSILNQNFDLYHCETILVDGLSQDRTVEIAKTYMGKLPNLRIIENEKRTVPNALNKGIAIAQGKYIIRMDVHSIYPKNYISALLHYMKILKADNVGGICITKPGNKGIVAFAIAESISHHFGVGNSYFRIKSKNIKEVDTVPFGCYRKEIFQKIGDFDPELTRNQDDEFNARLIENGGKIFLVPEIEIIYYARDKINKLFKMFYQYGLFKPLVNKKLKHPATLRQFVPVGFIIYLLIFLGTISIKLNITYLLFFPLFAYLFLSWIFSLILAIKKRKWLLIFIMPYLFTGIHISYGTGYIAGFLKHRIFQRTNNQILDINR